MRFRQRGIQLQRLERRGAGPRHQLLRWLHAVDGGQHLGGGEGRPAAGKAGIPLRDPLEVRDRRIDVRVRPLVEEVLPPEEQVVGLDVPWRGRRRAARGPGATAEARLDRVGDLARDLSFERQQAAGPAIVLLRPELRLVPGPDELGRHPDRARVPPHAAREQVLHAQRPPDPLRRLLAVLVLHHRRPRDHAEALRVAVPELGDHLLGQPVAQVLLPLVAGEVLKRQDREHHPAARGGPGSPGATTRWRRRGGAAAPRRGRAGSGTAAEPGAGRAGSAGGGGCAGGASSTGATKR